MKGQTVPTDKKEELEAGFRSVLEDVVKLTDSLKPYCESLDDLAGMAKLALTNDSQLRVLLALVTTPTPQRR